MQPWIGVVERPAVPVVASPSESVPLTIEVDPAVIVGQERKSGGIVIEYEDAHGSRTVTLPLNFAAYTRPELRWTGEHAPPPVRVQADKQRLKLVFCNRSDEDPQGGRTNAPVILESVTVSALHGDPEISVRQVSPLPQTLAGGGTCEVEFELNLEVLRPGLRPSADRTPHQLRRVKSAVVPCLYRRTAAAGFRWFYRHRFRDQ